MSDLHHERVDINSMPPAPTDETVVIPPPEHRDDKHEKKKGFWTRGKIIVAGGAAIAATGVAGVAAGALGGGNKSPEGKKDTPALVVGPDGKPLQYVEYSKAHSDRDADGFDDKMTDNNKDNVSDELELWDQQNQEFVDPQANANQEALASATPEQLADIQEIEDVWPDIAKSNPHWIADFCKINAQGRLYTMTVLHNRQEFATRNGEPVNELTQDTNWKSSILGGIAGEQDNWKPDTAE